MKEEYPYLLHSWVVESSHSQGFLVDFFSSDEAILEAMSGIEQTWEELHHRSYFLHKLDHLECDEFREILRKKIGNPVVPLSSPGHMAEGNMANLSPTIPINISCDPGKIENIYIGAGCSPDEIKEYTEIFKEFHDVFSWSYKDIPGIDPHIVEHEIKTYPDAKPV